jgi:Fur family transcriptional regulator, peroxide stress response regulator
MNRRRHARAERLLQGLEANGYKVTEQRVAVCEALIAHGGHPNAAEVYTILHERHPSISLATVYNTLTTLEQLGLLQAMPLATEEHTRYDLDLKPHINIVCQRCSAIVDAYSSELVPLLSNVARSAGATFESANVVVYGRCGSCA